MDVDAKSPDTQPRKRRGAHPDRALSAVFIRNVRAAGRYADGNGLYLVVDENGAKRWEQRLVVQGRRRDLGIGSTALVPLAEARELAMVNRKIARAGGDPLAIRRQQRAGSLTFERAAEAVHAAHKPAWRNAKHADQWINTLREYAFPAIGERRVDLVDSADVLKVLTPIWLTKPETARRVRQRVRAVLDWAKAAGKRSGENPVTGIAKALPKQPLRDNHHAALPYAEVSAFIRRLRASDAGEPVKLAFEFMILTAARTSEAINARWEQIDLDAQVWTIPATATKTGREHRVPLAPRVLALLQAAKEIGGGELVFPGQRIDKPLSTMAFLMALRRMGLGITAHGFRSSFRDWAAERTSFPREVCEMALAHAIKDKTEAAYRRGDLFEKRRDLMARWTAFATAAQAAVIPLRPGGGRLRWQAPTKRTPLATGNGFSS